MMDRAIMESLPLELRNNPFSPYAEDIKKTLFKRLIKKDRFSLVTKRELLRLARYSDEEIYT